MTFVWNDFGTLKGTHMCDKYLYVKNEKGDVLRMSLKRYKESALSVHESAKSLVGKKVRVRTSQNTAKWDTCEWFSDIRYQTVVSDKC